MILACKLHLYAYLTVKFDTVRVECLVFVVDTDNFVEKSRDFIYRRCGNSINPRMRWVAELCRKLLEEILQCIAVGVDLHKLVGILFLRIDRF
ncbi:hypothetical protein SDC9_77511 [bioreactor metagenome]|uniref:Uncharacterized protein n=1 Tax=bioreactor metagenome TaxID=1076179 RepID=A0A644YSL3_9ZZZZ